MEFALQKKKTRDCLECKVLPSCKVGAQTDKNCTSYWSRLQFQVLCRPGVFNAIEDDEIHFLCYCPKYLKLRNEFFVQIKSHLHNFHELSYSDLVIKKINSKDMYLNYDWRLISHYWIICVKCILSCKKNATWLSVINMILLFFFFFSFLFYVTLAIL